jgi:hypothetical protein
MKEPDALEGEAGKHPISVMEKREKLFQLDHRVRKRDLFGAPDPAFLKEILVPLLGDRVVFHIPLVDDPEAEVRVLLREMVAQFLNLFSRGR